MRQVITVGWCAVGLAGSFVSLWIAGLACGGLQMCLTAKGGVGRLGLIFFVFRGLSKLVNILSSLEDVVPMKVFVLCVVVRVIQIIVCGVS